MASQNVELIVTVPDGWEYGTRVQVYTDWGSGTVDETRPLLHEPFNPYEGLANVRGWGETAWGSSPWGYLTPNLRDGGWGSHPWGTVPWGGEPNVIRVRVKVPDAYGVWIFSVKAVDVAGNEQTDPLEEIRIFMSGIDPAPLIGFGYDSFAAGIATFTIS